MPTVSPCKDEDLTRCCFNVGHKNESDVIHLQILTCEVAVSTAGSVTLPMQINYIILLYTFVYDNYNGTLFDILCYANAKQIHIF